MGHKHLKPTLLLFFLATTLVRGRLPGIIAHFQSGGATCRYVNHPGVHGYPCFTNIISYPNSPSAGQASLRPRAGGKLRGLPDEPGWDQPG